MLGTEVSLSRSSPPPMLPLQVKSSDVADEVFGRHRTPIFFGLRRPDLAFIEVVMLWLSIVATIATFHSVNVAAAWLLLPYLAWVTFAAALNFTVWRLNRGPVSRS